MRELLGKIGRFCENHVEKLVLVVVCLVCAWIFFTKIIFSPNGVAYDGKTFSPGQIDSYIHAKAEDLRAPLQARSTGAEMDYVPKIAGPIDPNDPVVAEVFVGRPKPQSFLEVLEAPLAFMTSETMVADAKMSADVSGQPRYTLPRIGGVSDVDISYIRAAAYVPLEEVTPERTYSQVEREPNDIDLVTVEGKYDVAELYRQFQAHFAGTEVEKQAWRDPCLAEPTFGAVQLQRQRLLDDGRWGDWREVPRPKVEANRKLFTVLERVEDLPAGGVSMRKMHFENPMTTIALLQPEAYQIASVEEDWFPPSYYGKFKDLQRKVDAEERRKEREDRQQERGRQDMAGGRRREGAGAMRDRSGGTGGDRGRATLRGGGTGDQSMYGGGRDQRTRGRTRPGQQGMNPMMPGAGGVATRGRGARRGAAGQGYDMPGGYGGYPMDGALGRQQEVTTDLAYYEFAQDRLNYMTDLSKEKDPVLFWAMDDTAEPGGTYRYRIRIGVFNPVAGSDKLAPRDVDKKNQVILWSEFSEVTKAIDIPKRLYFFAKDVQEKSKTATVEVARYALGYWRTEDFRVQPGEVIGEEKEPEPEEEDDRRSARMGGGRITGAAGRGMMAAGPYGAGAGYGTPGMPAYGYTKPEDKTTPDIIDYRTHAVLVDLVPVSDWGADLKPRAYHDMLYTADGQTIEHMPVSTKNWPKNLLSAYQEIMIAKRKEPEPFRSFQQGSRGGSGGAGGMSPYGGTDMPGGMYGPGMR